MTESQSHQKAFDCGGCGAELTYAIGTERLTCEYCGTEQEIPQASAGTIREYDLGSALTQARRQKASDLVAKGTELRCEGCGARTVLEGDAGRCVYCDTPLVVVQEAGADVICPESVLPFKIPQDDARKAFKRWVAGLWFAPGDLTQRAAREAIDGVYVPYWTFDAQSESSYDGERGTDRWVDERYTRPDGTSATRKTQETRWARTSGRVSLPFDDLLVCANSVLPRDLIRSLEPWDLQDLRPYDPGYLSGFIAERYAVDLPQAYTIAQERFREAIAAAAKTQIGGDKQRVHKLDTELRHVKFKLTLLPLWLSAFRYEGTVHRFMVNARTGEISGKRPWSTGKIVLAVLGALVLSFCLVVGTGGLALPLVLVALAIAVPVAYNKVTSNS